MYFDEEWDPTQEEIAREFGRKLAERFILESTCGNDPDDPDSFPTWIYDEERDEWYEEP